jgi:hypothetical protein
MSRRLLPKDFDEEVLQKCLEECYRYGLEKISTKRIALLLTSASRSFSFISKTKRTS